VHDIADLERRGVVGVFVASNTFIDAAERQIESVGVDTRRVFIPHPIQDRTDDEMRALAEDAIDEILSAVTR
jgi:hypothetical protein